MKKIVFTLLIINSSIIMAIAQWVPMSNGIGYYARARSFKILENNIFAATSYGVYITTNYGVNWTQTSLNNQVTMSLEVIGNNIFAGTFGSGVLFSTNNGTNWVQTSLNNRSIHSLAVLGNNIFAGTEYNYGVYLSTNNGTNWTQTSLNNVFVWSLAVLGNNIFAGGGGVYISSNSGTSWTLTALNGLYVYALATLGNNIYAGTDSGVYLSTNNGNNWSQIGLQNQLIASVATSGNNIFAGAYNYGGVYLTTNNGINWFLKDQGLDPYASVEAFVVANNYIFSGANDCYYSVWRRSYSEIIGVQNISSEIPSGFSLYQNYPNPFNAVTKIRFEIPKSGFVKLIISDILGREIQTLVNEKQNAGSYGIKFDGSNLSSGIYFYTLKAGDYSETKKLVLLK